MNSVAGMKQASINPGTLLARARTAAGSGKRDAAATLFRQILELDSGHAEAHAWLCKEQLRRGEPVDAVRHGELAVNAKPRDIRLHEMLAKAHKALLAADDAQQALDSICADLPFAFTSQLYLSRAHELAGEMHDALLGYTRAIKTAQLRGFWLDKESTPPWLHAGVKHAMQFARERRIAFFHDWLQPMQERHGRDAMRRVAECLQMFLGIKPLVYADPRQKPSFLYFPGLPVAPVFPRDALPFADWYESRTDVIREEALRVLDTGDEIQPFHYTLPQERREKLTEGGNWDAYFFFNSGERFDIHHAACPRTSEVLAQLPLDHVREHGPEVCFSIMRPGAHILPHRGITNTRSVIHLGLEIPDGCALNLPGIEEVHWQPGKCFAFDDTYEHEAWNRSDRTRMILLGDIWNPYLTEPERDVVADLVGIIGDFNRATVAAPL